MPDEKTSDGGLPSNTLEKTKGRDYLNYTRLMDAALEAKAKSLFPHFGEVPRGAVIVDVGSGTGKLAEYAAREFRNQDVTVVAVDNSHELLEIADYNRSLISLVYDDATQLENIPDSSVDIMYHGTVGHEICSFEGQEGIKKALNACYQKLKPGGREVWRDFAKPEYEGDVYMQILDQSGVIVEEATTNNVIDYRKLSLKALFDCFYREFLGGQAFSFKIVLLNETEYIKLPAEFAQEFIMRKDYTTNWRQEILEKYTYWNPAQARVIFKNAGFSEVEVIKDDNAYIRNNRLRNKVRLNEMRDGDLVEVEYLTHMVIKADKPSEAGIQTEELTIPVIDYQKLLDSIRINDAIMIGERVFPVAEFIARGSHKQVFSLADRPNAVIKIVRSDQTNIHNVFKSMQQMIDRQWILTEEKIPHMDILECDREGPPYRYVIQEKLPEGSVCAAGLIQKNGLIEDDIAQMAEIVNKFETKKQWQLDTNPYNWYRVNDADGSSRLVYVGGTIYTYDESWSFCRVGLLQWLDPRYTTLKEDHSGDIPTLRQSKRFAREWDGLTGRLVGWWKKYLFDTVQPKLS